MRRKYLALSLGLLLLAGCAKLAPKHPNQLNDFDGYAYDTLIVAQDALEAGKAQFKECESAASPKGACVAILKPGVKGKLNTAIVSYNSARDAYAVYHGVGDKSLQANLEQLLADALRDIAAMRQAFGGGL